VCELFTQGQSRFRDDFWRTTLSSRFGRHDVGSLYGFRLVELHSNGFCLLLINRKHLSANLFKARMAHISVETRGSKPVNLSSGASGI